MATIKSNYLPGSSVIRLLHPRKLTPLLLATLFVGLFAAFMAMERLHWPLWGATALVLVFLFAFGLVKGHGDAHRYGRFVVVLSVLLMTQGFHSIEHLTQWFQFNVLHWSARASSGLLSPANAEWVHFVWNWLVLLVVI